MKTMPVALFGTFVEYYDYALYGFAAYSISQNFFPHHDPSVALLQTLLVFSSAALAKPLGALFFSHLGDKKGRVQSLRYSMFGIALPTTVIGLLPSYESWGLVSTLLLVFCRFLQGFLVAGEYDGVSIYIQEHVSARFACFGNSLVCASSLLGISLASLTSDICQTTFHNSYSWRIPFLLAGFLGAVALICRRLLVEGNSYKRISRPITWSELLQTNKMSILGAVCLCGAAGALYHFSFVFLPLVRPDIEVMRSTGLILFLIATPVAGLIADAIGAVRSVVIGSVAVAIMLIFVQLVPGEFSFALLCCVMPLAIVGSYVVMSQSIDAATRYRTVSVGHSIGSLALSSTTPVLCLYLWQSSHSLVPPFTYACGFALLNGMGVLCLQLRPFQRKDVYV